MPLFVEAFISEVLKKPVFDQKGQELGIIRDMVVVKGETLPGVEALVIESKKEQYRIHFKSLTLFNKKIITTTLTRKQMARYEFNEHDLLAVRDILDKQVVDVNGAKVVRVNDIKIEGYHGYAVLVAIDVGLKGILRRLGIEKHGDGILRFFKIKLPEHLIGWNYLQPLSPRLTNISLKMPQKLLTKMHPADIAEIISSISREEGAAFFHSLDLDSAAETLSELKPEIQLEVLSSMNARKAAEIVTFMSPDDAADLLPDLPKDKIKEIMENLEQEDAVNIQELIGHEEDTAGGLMTNEFLVYPEDLTVKETLKRFREDAVDLERIYYIYVNGKDGRLAGAFSLREILMASQDARLSQIMVTNIKSVEPEDDEDIVAAQISKYNLVAIPVKDSDGMILGIVTVDDIIDRILPPRAKRKWKKT